MNLEKDNTTISTSSVQLSSIPIEVLDIILQKAYFHSVLNENKADNQRDQDVIEKLSSVEFFWFQRILRFKTRIYAQLSIFYRKVFKLWTVIHANEQYLMENIQPTNELLETLESCKCLTKEQTHSFAKLCKDRDKVSEILFALRPFNEKKYDALIRCLRKTQRDQVLAIMDHGGAAIKVRVKSQKSTKKTEMVQHFMKTISKLEENKEQDGDCTVVADDDGGDINIDYFGGVNIFADEEDEEEEDDDDDDDDDSDGGVAKTNSEDCGGEGDEDEWVVENGRHDDYDHHTKKYISTSEGDVKKWILNTVDDRDLVVWIWIKSKDALEKLKEVIANEQFREAEAEDRTFVECDQLKNEIVFFPRIFADLKATFSPKEIGLQFSEILGVAALKNRIYLLQEAHDDSNPILVFDDKYPFCLQRTIKFKNIHGIIPRICSNEKENCLYISLMTDWTTRSWLKYSVIFKIEDEEKKNEVVPWMEFADNFFPTHPSVTGHGKLLMLGQKGRLYSGLCQIHIYGSDAGLCLSLDIREQIGIPLSAVQLSTGNFIILGCFVFGFVVIEVSHDGWLITQNFIAQVRYSMWYRHTSDICLMFVDSTDRLLLSVPDGCKVILLDSEDFQHNQTLIKNNCSLDAVWPRGMFYNNEEKQLIAVGKNVYIYTLSRR